MIDKNKSNPKSDCLIFGIITNNTNTEIGIMTETDADNRPARKQTKPIA